MSEVKGLPELKRRWEASGKTFLSVVSEALTSGADAVVSTAQFLVPVKSGRLRETIKRTDVRISKKGNPYILVSAGDASTQIGYKKIQLARVLEYGTKRTPAQPFMRPAVRANAKKIRADLRKAMKAAIKEANG